MLNICQRFYNIVHIFFNMFDPAEHDLDTKRPQLFNRCKTTAAPSVANERWPGEGLSYGATVAAYWPKWRRHKYINISQLYQRCARVWLCHCRGASLLGKEKPWKESFEIKKEGSRKSKQACVADKLIDICNKDLVRKIQIQKPPLLQTKAQPSVPPKKTPQSETN